MANSGKGCTGRTGQVQLLKRLASVAQQRALAHQQSRMLVASKRRRSDGETVCDPALDDLQHPPRPILGKGESPPPDMRQLLFAEVGAMDRYPASPG